MTDNKVILDINCIHNTPFRKKRSTFIRNGREISQRLSNSFRLNFRYFKTNSLMRPHYDREIIKDILNNVQKTIMSVLMTFTTNKNENEAKNKKIDYKCTK